MRICIFRQSWPTGHRRAPTDRRPSPPPCPQGHNRRRWGRRKRCSPRERACASPRFVAPVSGVEATPPSPPCTILRPDPSTVPELATVGVYPKRRRFCIAAVLQCGALCFFVVFPCSLALGVSRNDLSDLCGVIIYAGTVLHCTTVD